MTWHVNLGAQKQRSLSLNNQYIFSSFPLLPTQIWKLSYLVLQSNGPILLSKPETWYAKPIICNIIVGILNVSLQQNTSRSLKPTIQMGSCFKSLVYSNVPRSVFSKIYLTFHFNFKQRLVLQIAHCHCHTSPIKKISWAVERTKN